jgi:hypothetical protein
VDCYKRVLKFDSGILLWEELSVAVSVVLNACEVEGSQELVVYACFGGGICLREGGLVSFPITSLYEIVWDTT